MRWQLLGLRRAIALFVLGFCTTVFILMALAMGGAWARCFFALAGTYGVAFFAVAAEWFWGRWFAMGLGASGVTLTLLGILMGGWNLALAIWGGVHLLIYAPLLGAAMEARFEGQPAWRERYRIDGHGVGRIKRAVKSAAATLPTLIIYGLAPREGGMAWALPLLAGLGLVGLLRLRFWGVALLGGAAAGTAASVLLAGSSWTALGASPLWLPGLALLALAFLGLAISPFLIPAWRTLRGR